MYTGQITNAAVAMLPSDTDVVINIFSSDVGVIAFQDTGTLEWTLDTLSVTVPAGTSGFSYTVKAVGAGTVDIAITSPDITESATCSVTVTCQTVINDIGVIVIELGKVIGNDFNAADDFSNKYYYDDHAGVDVGTDKIAHTVETVCDQWRQINVIFSMTFAAVCPGDILRIDISDPRTIDSLQQFDVVTGQNTFRVDFTQPTSLTYDETVNVINPSDSGVDITFVISLNGTPLTNRRASFTLTL